MDIEERLFDVADEWLVDYMQRNENTPVIGQNKKWLGTIEFMIKIDEFVNKYGANDEEIINYQVLENLRPELKELNKLLSQKPDADKMIKYALTGITKDNYKDFEIDFKDIIVSDQYGSAVRIYTCFDDYYTDPCGVISVDFDYPISQLKNLIYITGGCKKPIIGLEKGDGKLKDRAVLAVMPLDHKPHAVKRAIRKQYKSTKKLFDSFYADELKRKENDNVVCCARSK